MKKLTLTILIILLPLSCFGETIITKSGQTIEGRIIEKTDQYVKIDFEGTPLTYFMDEIASIGEDGAVEKSTSIKNETDKYIAAGQSYHKESAPVDDRVVFEKRLSEFLLAFQNAKRNASEENKYKVEEAAKKLSGFSADYPSSSFADDAIFLPNYILFQEALRTMSKHSALKFLNGMKEILKYPDGSLEDSSDTEYIKVAGSSIAPGVPNKYIVPYMQGCMGAVFGDQDAVIANFGALKNNLDFTQEKSKLPASRIYTYLVTAFIKKGRNAEAVAVANEALQKFPQDAKLKQAMERFLEKNKK